MTAQIISLADRRRTVAPVQNDVSMLLRKVARRLGIDISDIESPSAKLEDIPEARILQRSRRPDGADR
jgi:hypothetical protein